MDLNVRVRRAGVAALAVFLLGVAGAAFAGLLWLMAWIKDHWGEGWALVGLWLVFILIAAFLGFVGTDDEEDGW